MCLLVLHGLVPMQAGTSVNAYDLSAYACNLLCQFFVEFLGNKGKTYNEYALTC